MSVGGTIIEKVSMTLPESGRAVVRYAVMDGSDEVCVYAEPSESEPSVGDAVWWQSGKIYFDNDKQTLTKVGFSFRAPWSRAALSTSPQGGEHA